MTDTNSITQAAAKVNRIAFQDWQPADIDEALDTLAALYIGSDMSKTDAELIAAGADLLTLDMLTTELVMSGMVC